MKGKRIWDLDGLKEAAIWRRAVVVPRAGWTPWQKPKPATFMLNLTGSVLLRLFNVGMYIYEKEK